MKDENNQEMYKSVEEYALNQKLWINDFLNAWSKMQKNGYNTLDDGPTGYWSHRCCFYRQVAYYGKNLEGGIFLEIPNEVECQKMCQETGDCEWFGYITENKRCMLKSAKPTQVVDGPIDAIAGPAHCPMDDNFCDAYKAL